MDVVHAATALGVAAGVPTRRPLALANAATAGVLAVAGARGGRRARAA